MSGRRVLALYGALLLGFAAVVCRLYWLCSNTDYAVRAAAQSEAILRLPAARGNFYDCGGLPLTGISQRWLALCFPGESSYARLYPYADADGQARLYRERNTSRPFLLDVVQDVSGLGVRCYAVPRRYAAAPLAEQLIGYLDSEGHGAAGLEAALDDVLYTGERDTLHCAVTAQGRLRRGSEPILEKADSAPQGVRLTLSRSIQRAAEGVAAESMATGCILIIDAASGKVRACVSLPDFDAANVGESLTAPDSPLLNRAFSAYAVGSVFKPVLAAAALEAGEGDFTRECPGYDALNGQVYRCAGSVPHGLVGLDGALEKSCNGYFIELGRKLGPERVRQMAAALGFGKGQDIAGGLRSASGVLPETETLENEGQFANFCFGQGELLATPLQVAGMMNTIAAGGLPHPAFRGVYRGRDDGRRAHAAGTWLVPAGVLGADGGKTAGASGGRRGRGNGPAGSPLRGDCRRKDRHRPDRPVPGWRRAEKLLVRRFLPGRKAPLDHRGDAGRPDRAGSVQRSRLCPPVRRTERRRVNGFAFLLAFWAEVCYYILVFVCLLSKFNNKRSVFIHGSH